jgi:hypothetical protein
VKLIFNDFGGGDSHFHEGALRGFELLTGSRIDQGSEAFNPVRAAFLSVASGLRI